MAAQVNMLHEVTSQVASQDFQVVVLAMDAGMEIDDEIAAWILLKYYLEGYVVFFCQVPGASSEPDSVVVAKRLERMREIFPEQFGTKNIWCPDPENPRSSKFVLVTLSQMLHHPCLASGGRLQVDWFIQIAPLWGFEPDDLRVFDIKTRIFMGDLENPENSINGTKAMPKDERGDNLRAQFAAQEEMFAYCKTISIPTSFARQVPTPVRFINGLPSIMKDELLKTAFEQFAGRPDPTLPWAENISRANHSTITGMLPAEFSGRSDPRLEALLNKFLLTIEEKLIKDVLEINKN